MKGFSRYTHACFLFVAVVLALIGACRDEGRSPDAAETGSVRSLAARLPPDEPRPTFEFPDRLRSKNESLNAFLEDFREICEQGEYERYRQAVTIQLDPVDRHAFENIWNAVEHIRVELIKRLPELEEVPSPAYAVLLRAQLREEFIRDRAERLVTIVAFREENEWVFAPSPDERINQAMRSAVRDLFGSDPDDSFAATQPAASSGPAVPAPPES